ncbi:hypothetical protein ES332_D06G145700v1 [Gossypium tomentosum]|uniref:MADS-box domain-containing protein n=1 Tax=Gossypium tomentosum TaxID=34277 RepID=A0A5D2KL13_GOSTO|nr:hypothetical protein ES332_D06G145700v1 [Gossypium tomentosum]
MASSDKKTKESKKLRLRSLKMQMIGSSHFSKRRTGIYKKVSELSILCGGEILFIIFSPAGKPYSFGHPSVESVAKRFSNAGQHLEETTDAPVETYRKERINCLYKISLMSKDQLDVIKEKQMEIALAQRSHGTEIRHWWKAPIDQLNVKELYEQDERFAEILFIIFSLAGKPYSFSHPPDESVAKRFSNASQHLEETTDAPVETYRKERINLLVQDFNDVQDQLDVIKVKQKEIALAKRSNGTKIRYWWKAPIDQLNLRELYEQDERFAEFNNLITITRDKKNAAISSMKALMDEDFPSAFPPKYGLNQQ